MREVLYQKIKTAGYPMATILGLGCSVHPSSRIGEGCVLFDCIVSANVDIGANVFVFSKAGIGHDAVIGAHSVISALCFIGGHTEVGSRVYMAPGAMAKDRIRIGDDAILSLGAVALRRVKDKAIMIGNPAKKIGDNIDGKVFNISNSDI